ncbi:sugar-transfer associated ATP-grasp domain-containing protein [Acuticoccus sp.]|uniref:sugar-transfer associated ATP-grasp domain-containing protein n=1 Tax=Acuticoccus sp. TaxID=1904378 RepID=UPI003B523FB8
MRLLPYRVRRRLAPYQALWRFERANAGPTRPALLARGFLSNRAELYPFGDHDAVLFLTDVEVEVRLPRLNAPDASRVFSDKRAFHEAVRVGQVPARTADLVAVVEDGAVRLHGAFAAPEAVLPARMIAKPAEGSGGRGVLAVRSLAEVPRTGVMVVEAAIEPHPDVAAIFPGALNTVRVLTGRLGDATPLLLGATHRFGTSASAPTDNFKAGGLVAALDLASGRLGSAVALGGDGRRRTFDRHPDTGAPIAGRTVPHWRDVIALALACAGAVPGLSYAGWDIAIDSDGAVLVEGNAGLANPNIVQAHGPLLTSAAIADYFAAVGVLSPGRRRRVARALGEGRGEPVPALGAAVRHVDR